MAFQSTVNINAAFGVPGELIFDGPQRAQSLTLDSNGGTIGYFFTKSNSTGVATVGGVIATGVVMAGILVNPKAYATSGTTAGGTLAPTLVLPGNAQADFLTMGTIVVQCATAANIGDEVIYNTTTGALSAQAPGATPGAGYAKVPNAIVTRYPTAAAGLVAITLTN